MSTNKEKVPTVEDGNGPFEQKVKQLGFSNQQLSEQCQYMENLVNQMYEVLDNIQNDIGRVKGQVKQMIANSPTNSVVVRNARDNARREEIKKDKK